LLQPAAAEAQAFFFLIPYGSGQLKMLRITGPAVMARLSESLTQPAWMNLICRMPP